MAYVDDGYVIDGYTAPTITAPNKVSNVNVIVKINEVIITSSNIVSANIETNLNTPYHILTMAISNYTLDESFIKNKDVRLEVSIGNDTYSFIIMEADKDYQNNINIIGKTEQVLLEEPFSVVENSSYYGSSLDIISDLATPILLQNLENIQYNFINGAFSLTDVPLNKLKKLLEPTKSDIYPIKSALFIEKAFRIPENSVPKLSLTTTQGLITSYSKSNNYDGSPLVSSIIFNSNFGDIYSEPSITYINNKGCSVGRFLLNPLPSSINLVKSNLGTLKSRPFTTTENVTLDRGRVIRLVGGIKSIKSIFLDNIVTPMYSFQKNHNVIVLDAVYSGIVTITYVTEAIMFFTSLGDFNANTNNWIKRVSYLDQYLEVEVPLCEDSILEDGGTSKTPNGGCSLSVSQNIAKANPTILTYTQDSLNMLIFTATDSDDTIGYSYNFGNILMKFSSSISVAHREEVTNTISSALANITLKGNAKFEEIEGSFGIVLGDNQSAPSSFKIGTNTLSFSNFGNSFDFDFWEVSGITESQARVYLGYSVDFLYTTALTELTIPSISDANSIFHINAFYCENGFSRIDYPNPENDTDKKNQEVLNCALPQTFRIDLTKAKYLNLPLNKIAGGSGVSTTLGTVNINNYGEISVNIITAQKHEIDFSSIRNGAILTIDTTYSV